ncbi:MAG: LuxR C-terminal-related transcriptional regulator [Sulfuricurvum sp.]|uniref:response regulator transcription factor n=1 Tax=Sulfuricurvum sp. TaxID=2025608 RepID=UPI00262CC4EB|nr:LuxR C-terminal-related transcriptional regulator [Sulfuricurvum sp.]MDD2368058.1 LuxR C-terminal-related transcriptional regulator [Sulfuricurvum sp.]MDD2950868.1 LuxR C-terminal-related transcriptional regulator [Sulfuricurvum sp.]MDD5118299.1 LuxR C-terminal-related transcriptional regulator [Sulfuricurvum sp.]
MKLYLISNDITLRSRWIGILSSLHPTTLSEFSLEIQSPSIVMIDDKVLADISEETLEQFFKNRVMVLSMTPNFVEAQRFLALGAMGYGNAMMHGSHLYSVYQALEEGKIWLHPDFITLMISQMQNRNNLKEKSLEILDALSKREREVALMLGDGATHQEISDTLDITVRTVKAHATAIYQKLNVKDRLALSLLLHS